MDEDYNYFSDCENDDSDDSNITDFENHYDSDDAHDDLASEFTIFLQEIRHNLATLLPNDVLNIVCAYEQGQKCRYCGPYREVDPDTHVTTSFLSIPITCGSGSSLSMFLTLKTCLWNWTKQNLTKHVFQKETGCCGQSKCLSCAVGGVQIYVKRMKSCLGSCEEVEDFVMDVQQATDVAKIKRDFVDWVDNLRRQALPLMRLNLN